MTHTNRYKPPLNVDRMGKNWNTWHVVILQETWWYTYRIMQELSWITIFWSRVRWFANDFHEWRSHSWKSLANHLTSDPKIVIHGNECIILFLTRYFMLWTHNSAINNHRSLILPSSPRTLFSVLALWRHHSWSVMSHKLALWRHIGWLLLHMQIGAKAIFISE